MVTKNAVFMRSVAFCKRLKYSIHKRGEIAMKNILKIMLMMITIFTIAGSAVYAAEIPVSDQDQLITSSDWTEISNLQDEMTCFYTYIIC